MYLVVSDIEAARAELLGRGVDVSEIYHYNEARERVRGRDPEGRSYSSYASFKDPDGNGWVLQEIKTPLPGRVAGLITDVTTLTELLREAEKRHGEYERTAAKHHWSGWYAAYIVAREAGRTSDEAAGDAALHMDRARDPAQGQP
jgi:hypothetical protein